MGTGELAFYHRHFLQVCIDRFASEAASASETISKRITLLPIWITAMLPLLLDLANTVIME